MKSSLELKKTKRLLKSKKKTMELVQIYLICFKKITITTNFFNLNLYIFLLNFLFWIRNRIQESKWIRIRVHCPGSKYINAVWSGHESVGCHYVPNAFLMSCLLFLGTFLISSTLKSFKTGSLFPTVVRWMANCVSCFSSVDVRELVFSQLVMYRWP